MRKIFGKITMASLEKLLFPGFLIFFEAIILVLFGLLVDYDESGSPDQEILVARNHTAGDYVRELESTLSTTKTYSCK